nr:MAG TPA: hypothetical protein [Caudoviricetes sp.]
MIIENRNKFLVCFVIICLPCKRWATCTHSLTAMCIF